MRVLYRKRNHCNRDKSVRVQRNTRRRLGSMAPAAVSSLCIFALGCGLPARDMRTVPQLSIQAAWSGPSTITLALTSNSDASASYAVTSGPGTVSGSALTVTGAGEIDVSANQVSNASFLSGTAAIKLYVSAASVDVAPTILNFPQPQTNTSSSKQIIQVTNSGDLPAQILNVNANANFEVTTLCAATIPAHSGCQYSVSFKPQTSGGSRCFNRKLCHSTRWHRSCSCCADLCTCQSRL